jgi:hypothetical protein
MGDAASAGLTTTGSCIGTKYEQTLTNILSRGGEFARASSAMGLCLLSQQIKKYNT